MIVKRGACATWAFVISLVVGVLASLAMPPNASARTVSVQEAMSLQWPCLPEPKYQWCPPSGVLPCYFGAGIEASFLDPRYVAIRTAIEEWNIELAAIGYYLEDRGNSPWSPPGILFEHVPLTGSYCPGGVFGNGSAVTTMGVADFTTNPLKLGAAYVQLNANEDWAVTSLRSVVRHEIGHALGLGHTNAACSTTTLMSIGDCGAERLIDDSARQGLNCIYGTGGECPGKVGIVVRGPTGSKIHKLVRCSCQAGCASPMPTLAGGPLTYELAVSDSGGPYVTYATLQASDWVNDEYTYSFDRFHPLARIRLRVFEDGTVVDEAFTTEPEDIPGPPVTHTLTVNAANGTVARAPDQPNYDYGTVVTLTAAPAVGYQFVDWTGDLTGTANPSTITMDADKTVTANFAVVSCNPPPCGRVAWWPADGNGDDSIGLHPATLVNGAAFAPGKRGLAFSLDGVDDRVDLSADALVGGGADPFTVALWVNLVSGPEVNHYTFLARLRHETQFILGLGQDFQLQGAYLAMAFRQNTHQFYVPLGAIDLVGRWTHVAAVYTGGDKNHPSGYRLYIDGELATNTLDIVSTVAGSENDNGLGYDPFPGTGRQNLHGSIDDVQVFNRALSASEIAELIGQSELDVRGYWRFEGTGTVAADSSGHGNHGQISGGAVRTSEVCSAFLPGTSDPGAGAPIPNLGALLCDDTSGGVTIPDSPSLRPSSELTLSAWIRPGVNPGAIVGKHVESSCCPSFSNSYQLEIETSESRHIVFTLSDDAPGTIQHRIFGPSMVAGRCYQIVGTWDGALMRLYVDGIEVGQEPFTGPIGYDANPVLIGADDDMQGPLGCCWFDGQIDEVRLLGRALGPDEVTAVAEGQVAPRAFQLHPGSPNPFDGNTVIRYSLPDPGRVDISVVDVRGRLVRHLVREPSRRAGDHQTSWDGRDFRGIRCAPGVYFVVLRTQSGVESRKLALLR